MKFATKAIHVGEELNLEKQQYGDVVVPIHLSVTFAKPELDMLHTGYDYTRTGNPTREALEKRLAALEDAKFALAFASGMAAETTLLLSLLEKGDHIVAFNDLYGGTRRLFNSILSNFGLDVTYVDARYLEKVDEGIRDNTKLVWIETPTNPMMRLCDIAGISKIGKTKNIITVVDNTFMSPYFQTPLNLGADIVLHSTTKYLGGHSDVLGGAIMLSNKTHYEKIKYSQNAIGAVPSPFDCFLVMRGIKTLAIRMNQHNQNAQQIAAFLNEHPKIGDVHFPGLPNHPQYNLAKQQMRGFGGMLSFTLNRPLKQINRFLKKLKLFRLAESLGGVESLIEHPALMTHASISKNEREKLGITDNLIRVSVGIEDIEDLIKDLEDALNAI